MKVEFLFVRSLEDYLAKYIQPIIKNYKLLKVGRSFKNIKLRPREVLGAFLVCVVIRFISKQNWTPARDPMGGDGVILCREPNRTDQAFLEQVYVPRIGEKAPASMDEIEERIESEINRKHNKGKAYFENRHLIIFLDIEGSLNPQKIKGFVNGFSEGFDSYWLFAPWDKKYSYLVFLLKADRDEPSGYSVEIREDFKGWEVKRLGRL